MKRASSAGFTIIETMLVLSISGVLTIGLVAGAGIAIAQQRYRESVLAVQSFIQDGYNLTTVIENGNTDATANCTQSALNEVAAGTGQPRGTTDCLLVGRFITIRPDGALSAMRSANVIAYQTGDEDSTTDADLTANYSFRVSPIDQLERTIPWQSYLTQPGSSANSNASILIMRSPQTNTMLTYSSSSAIADAAITTLIQDVNRTDMRTLCVANDSWVAGKRQAVQIQPNASGPGSIAIPSETENVCET